MLFHLSHYQVLRLSGVDIETYLQGQLTADIKHLKSGDHSLTAHCDPKGKVHSLFRLLRDGDIFYAIVEESLIASTLQHLQKYAIFSKVTFEQLDWAVFGSINDESLATHATFTLNLSNHRQLYLCDHALFIQPQWNDCRHWQFMDYQLGYPHFSYDIIDQFIPQALNLDQLERCLSFSKGCYIGQETIARAKFRGINKRTLALFESQGEALDCKVNDPLMMQLGDNQKPTGNVLSHLYFEGKNYIQAVINKENLAENFRFSGQALSLISTQTVEEN